MATTNNAAGSVPSALRLGGAFVFVGLVFLIMEVIALLQNGIGEVFELTIPHVLVLVAAGIFGAFPSSGGDAKVRRIRLVVLGLILLAFILKVTNVAAGSVVLLSMGQWWLVCYAFVCFAAAFLLRRSVAQAVHGQR